MLAIFKICEMAMKKVKGKPVFVIPSETADKSCMLFPRSMFHPLQNFS